MKTFKFKLGDLGLAQKRGHCSACSHLEAELTIEAGDEAAAIEKLNALINDGAIAIQLDLSQEAKSVLPPGHERRQWRSYGTLRFRRDACTKRELVKE